MIVDNIEYELLFASDVERDGLGLECYRGRGAERECLLEVSRSDAQRTYVVTQYVKELPLALFERIIATARTELGPINA